MLYKGIFWYVGEPGDERAQPRLPQGSLPADGASISGAERFDAKAGDNFNHRLSWEILDKTVTRKHGYRYYSPRTR